MTKQTHHPVDGAYGLSSHELTHAEIMQRAHRARAEAVGNMLADLGKAVGRWFKAVFRSGRERQRIMNELYSLDDRSLSDLGITRGDIPFVAKGQSRLNDARNDNGARAA